MIRIHIVLAASLIATQATAAFAQAAPRAADSRPTVRFVAVNNHVKLEVLDWGGSNAGRPIVFLAGLGNTPHDFDKFALNFTGSHHVYGITRRGFGNSSKPTPADDNYSADRLGDDVLAVCDALKLDHPVLVGHSIAGEELSSIGSRHPEKVSGLVYLDAAGPSAFYNAATGNYGVELAELRRRLDQLTVQSNPDLDKARIRELLQSNLLQRFEGQLQSVLKVMEAMPPTPPNTAAPLVNPSAPYVRAVLSGQQMYTVIKGPILAIVAIPHDYDRNPPPDARTSAALNLQYAERQVDAFQATLPNARVVRLPYASHFVFRSNEADVVREMNAFLASLP